MLKESACQKFERHMDAYLVAQQMLGLKSELSSRFHRRNNRKSMLCSTTVPHRLIQKSLLTREVFWMYRFAVHIRCIACVI